MVARRTEAKAYAKNVFKNEKIVEIKTLSTSLLTKTGIPTFPCYYCDKKYAKLSSLRVHRHVHYEKPFPCYYCDKQYAKLSSLRNHRRLCKYRPL